MDTMKTTQSLSKSNGFARSATDSDIDSLRKSLDESVALLRRYVDEHDATWNKLSDHTKTAAMARETQPHGHNENPTRAAMRAFLKDSKPHPNGKLMGAVRRVL